MMLDDVQAQTNNQCLYLHKKALMQFRMIMTQAIFNLKSPPSIINQAIKSSQLCAILKSTKDNFKT